MAKCPFYISVKASIVDSVRIGKKKKSFTIASEGIAKQCHSYLTGISAISPRPNLTPGFFFLFIQAYEIMSQLICLNGQRRILENDKNVAPGKNQPFWMVLLIIFLSIKHSCHCDTHTLKTRRQQNNNNKLHTVIWCSLHLQRQCGLLLTQLHLSFNAGKRFYLSPHSIATSGQQKYVNIVNSILNASCITS